MLPQALLLSGLIVGSAVGFVPATVSRLHSSTALDASALIIQNKGGGHGELGYQLAKTLQSAPYSDTIDSITILQDDECQDDQEPFQSYTKELEGVEIVYAPITKDTVTLYSLELLLGYKKFDYVFDNNSKKPEGPAKACADIAKQWDVKLYVYVSSAGMYEPTSSTTFPMDEATTPIKESSGQAKFDAYCVEIGLPLVSFRPQYIYGDKANKYDYIDYFFDRLVRQLPIPIPEAGDQMVSLTHAEDVASLLASPILQPEKAIAQRFFNCGTDALHSYDDVAHMCAKAADITEYDVEHFDSKLLGKGKFPFRMTNFYVAPDKAKELLGWAGPKHSLADDLPAYHENFVARGKPLEQMSWIKDWEIVVGHITPQFGYVSSVYDKYDPLIIED